jgi:Uma2 family endonuclease
MMYHSDTLTTGVYMAARIEPLMTVDDLEAMPEDGNRYEVIEGELFVSRAPGLPHQLVATSTVMLLGTYLRGNPIGVVVATPGLILDQHSGVIPDIVFFTHQRAKQIIANERLGAAPELVIEILSPGRENSARDRVAKRQLYGKNGVQEYWIIDSENTAIEVYRLNVAVLDLVAILRGTDELTSFLLPGFSCEVLEFFSNQ